MIRSYLEAPDAGTLAAYDRLDLSALRKDLFAGIVDQGYPGDNLEDLSLVPRVLPNSYIGVIREACNNLTRALINIASKNQGTILEWLKPDRRWKKLIFDHGVFERTPDRLVGELRFDFAVCGPLTPDNPPRLMEVNGGALGVIAHASFLPSLLHELVPGLEHLTTVDLRKAFGVLCSRVGPDIANICIGEYSWGEDILSDSVDGFHLLSMQPLEKMNLWPKLCAAEWVFDNEGFLQMKLDGTWKRMDGLRWARVLNEEDIECYGRLLKRVTDSATTFMSPLRMDYVCHKGILPLLCNSEFLTGQLGISNPSSVTQYVLPSWPLHDIGFPPREDYGRLVLKQNFGCSGKGVFVGKAISAMEAQVSQLHEWTLQRRVELNQMYAPLLYSQDRPVRMDLAAFVYYDAIGGHVEHCEVAGLVSRGSSAQKVNLNLGGVAIPVLVKA
jgi:hypothetical protein